MNWLLTAGLCIIVIEIALRLPMAAVVTALGRSGGKSLRVVRSKKISDHWKEKALGAYSKTTFAASMKLAGLLAGLLAVAAVLVLGFGWIAPGFESYILGWSGIGFSLVFATLYVKLRTTLAPVASSEYSAADQILHRLALQVGPVAEMSFDLDQKLVSTDPADITSRRHVFVSGLARSGTTVLMRNLYASGDFRSLTYRDMPFVLAPNRWRKLRGKANSDEPATERAHGDRILVNADSPESLDEVYWRIFDGASYISKTALAPHHPDAETRDGYVRYVNAILTAQDGNAQRYLSKNNNNILRLQSLRQCFPEALILIPFRAPGTHAASLLGQHRNFIAQQGKDPFVTRYMSWLGHHEFGRDHRPFQFGPDRDPQASNDPETLAYWVTLWCDTYEWLLETAPQDAIFVCYEDLCRDPAVWPRLAAIAGVAPGDTDRTDAFSLSEIAAPDVSDPALRGRAETLYTRLCDRARDGLAAGA